MSFLSRHVPCDFARIGCPWLGPFHERTAHHAACSYPRSSGQDVMSALQVQDEKRESEMKLFQNIFSLLSFEKIAFSGKYLVYRQVAQVMYIAITECDAR